MKPIILDDTQKDLIMQDFTKYINDLRIATDNGISYSRTYKNIFQPIIKQEDMPVVYMSQLAYLKTLTLMHSYTGEIAWHGLVNRNGNHFYIKDILVYPQTVSSVSVEADDMDYQNWLLQTVSDEDLPNLRFQAHSHANMGVSPSATDKAMFDNILKMLGKNDYYIFAIMNKSNESNFYIFDYANNLYYEPADITLRIVFEDIDMSEWLAEVDSLVTIPIKSWPKSYSNGSWQYEEDDIPSFASQAKLDDFTKKQKAKGGKK